MANHTQKAQMVFDEIHSHRTQTYFNFPHHILLNIFIYTISGTKTDTFFLLILLKPKKVLRTHCLVIFYQYV